MILSLPKTVKYLFAAAAFAACCGFAFSAVADDVLSKQDQAREAQNLARALRKIDSFEPLSAGDRAALKAAARKMSLQSLRVCADPGNMPLSNMKGEGYDNKILDILAKAMNTHVEYYWLPYFERAFLRQTFGEGGGENHCDVLLDIPVGYEGVALSDPIYKTTYVLAFLSDKNYQFKSFDDPLLQKLRIGVYQTSGIRQVFLAHGITQNVIIQGVSHDADLNPQDQPAYQLQQVIDGKLDVAGAWGPFAGYYKTVKHAPISIQPVNLMEDQIPLEFEIGLGIRLSAPILRYKIDLALNDNAAAIEKVLRDYGVPLVKCSGCIVEGDLPSHGAYAAPPTPASELKSAVTTKELKSWLAAGANVDEEFSNAVMGGAIDRASLLLDKGADPNKPDEQGETPLINAVQSRNDDLVKLLLSHGAKVNARDSNGMSALLVAVQLDDASIIKLLAARGANLNEKTTDEATPLALAIVDNKLRAALALIDAGASVNATIGELGLTPLMVAAGRQQNELTLQGGVHEAENLSTDPRYPDTLQIARALIAHKADVNAVSKSGVTALMLAAAHDNPPIVGLLLQSGADLSTRSPDKKTALDLAVENGNDSVVSLIRLIQQARGR